MRNKVLGASLLIIFVLFSLQLSTGILNNYSWKKITNPEPALNLAGPWRLCLGINAKDCQEITVPHAEHPAPNARNFQWLSYSKSFPRPRECNSSQCSLLFSEIGDAAEIRLNDVLIKTSGSMPPHFRYAKHYPVSISIPPELLKNENSLQIKVYTSKIPQSGIRGKFNGIFLQDDVRQFEKFTNFYNIDLPLYEALLFLIFALYALREEKKTFESKQFFRTFKWSSLFAALFMLSYSSLQKETATPWVGNVTHHLLRHLMDWSLIWFLLTFYGAEPSAWKQKRFKIYKVIQNIWKGARLFSHGLMALGTIVFIITLCAFSVADDTTKATFASELPFKITTAFGWVKCFLLPILLMGAATDTRERPLGRMATTLLLLVFVYFQLDDMLGFSANAVGISWAKLYPALMQFFYFTKIDEIKDFEIFTRAKKTKVDAEKAKINQRVAHNIRHPLAALNQLIRRVSTELSPADLRDFKSCATSLTQTVIELEGSKPLQFESESTLVAVICERAFEFKRVEYQHLPVELSLTIADSALGVFCKVIPNEISATLSNLIKNSMEACDGISGARIDVTIKRHPSNGRLEIVVTDNGKGIPPEVLEVLAKKGISFGKTGGQGIGIAEARKYMESLGGTFHIHSKELERTTVILTIPPCQIPPFMASHLDLSGKNEIVIVDHDEEFSEFIKARLAAHAPKMKVSVISNLSEFEKFLEACEGKLSKKVLLVDNFFPKTEVTGLEIIEKYEIQNYCYLATHQIEDPELIRDARLIGAKIIPKIMTPVIQIVTGKQNDGLELFILIDNDKQIRNVWEESAKKKKVHCKIFSSVRDFYRELPMIPYGAKFYVDANIHGHNDGITVARDVQFLGFAFVKIASGTSQHNAPADAQDLDFVGKEPPWLRKKAS